MNNPHNLSHKERAITPMPLFNKGINVAMSPARRARKQARHRDNAARRLQKSQNELPKK